MRANHHANRAPPGRPFRCVLRKGKSAETQFFEGRQPFSLRLHVSGIYRFLLLKVKVTFPAPVSNIGHSLSDRDMHVVVPGDRSAVASFKKPMGRRIHTARKVLIIGRPERN